MNILLVEDDEFVRTLIGTQLEQAGHLVTAHNNASDGLNALKEGPFDLLITDLVLPNMNGLDMMKQIRSEGNQIPIIAITGGVENAQDDYQHAADMFADATLVKPISKDDLYEAVNLLTS